MATGEQRIFRVMSGEAAGVLPGVGRGVMWVGVPFYSIVTGTRNFLFDRRFRGVHPLGRRTISVGNVTTGGTGKTPVVRWIAERFRAAGHRPAILMRGYKSVSGKLSDEQAMLNTLLNSEAKGWRVIVHANPDRVAGARQVLAEHPEVDIFILDDGFQHRRAARNLDLVLINAVNPFGFGHLLPRGLLRESLGGLRRANAIILTHCDEVSVQKLDQIQQEIRRHNPCVPFFHTRHAIMGLRVGSERVGLDRLQSRRYFAFCGIGNPDSFVRQFETLPGELVGRRIFPDHHHYTPGDVIELEKMAREAGADVLVTTEKDWAKLQHLSLGSLPECWRLDLDIRFFDGEESLLGDLLAVDEEETTDKHG